MGAREVVKENEGLLKGVVRSIDKSLDYSVLEISDPQAPRFSLHLALRGHESSVSLSVEDLKASASDPARRNAIRQKIKHARDHMLDDHIPDVVGKKIAKMLKQSGASEEDAKRGFFRRSSGPRR